MIYLLTIIIILGIIGIFLILFMVKEAFANRVIQNELLFPDFPESFGEVKIFFISDIHKRVISDQLVEEVKGMKPDMVIIGGDLMERKVPLQRVEANISKLKTLGPVFFVWGNNDYEGNYHHLDVLLLDNGVKILDNTAVTFESLKGDKFILLGIDDISQKRARLDLALLDAGEDGFKVLVSHSPEIVSSVKKEHQIQLVLCGHTHGGQIHLFGYSPYPKGSVKKLPQTTLLVSNGYGTTALPFRLGAKAETHLVTLRKQ